MQFKPEDFDKFSTTGYMDLADGANKFRILGEPITGYVYQEYATGGIIPRGEKWPPGSKKHRVKSGKDLDMRVITNMKPFCSMIVYNYGLNKVQILEITQSSIMSEFDMLAENPSWGEPTEYDIVITRKKTGPEPINVEYKVMPEPKSEISKEVLEAYEAVTINLQALYEGKDPFQEELDVDAIAEEVN